MPLLNYTTSVAVEKTASEIQALLARHGATDILTRYENGQPVGLSFRINTPQGVLPFTVPVNIKAIKAVLERQYGRRQVPRSAIRAGQPERVAWRIIKDWIEAQMALLETEMVTLDQIFLPYLRLSKDTTLYDYMLESGFSAVLPERAESLQQEP